MLRSHSRADASSLFVEKERLSVRLQSADGSTTQSTKNARTGSCSVSSPSSALDFADCNGLGGWALDQNNLGQAVTIDIYVDGVKTYSDITANGDRQDLVGAFGGNQAARYHGFNYQFPANASWKNGQNHSISVRICGVNGEVNGSPKTVGGCSGGTTDDFTSNPELVQYNPYPDDDYDPVSFGGGAGGFANAPAITHLPSYLAPDTEGLNSIGFSGSTDLSNRSEYEVRMMASRVLTRLGLNSVDQLAHPPFLPILTFNGLDQIQQVSREYELLKLKNSTWSKERCLAQASVNYFFRTLHIVLDVVGFVPGAGDLGDAVNGGIYLLEGDKINAAFSFAATVPLAGWAATTGKWANRGLKAIGGSAFESAEGLIYASRTYAKDKASVHALSHIYQHFKNDLSKDYHGIFTIPTNELAGLIDDAWLKVKNNTPGIKRSIGNGAGNDSYLVPMDGKTIGMRGGRLGNGQPLTKLRIFIDRQKPNHIATAYPE